MIARFLFRVNRFLLRCPRNNQARIIREYRARRNARPIVPRPAVPPSPPRSFPIVQLPPITPRPPDDDPQAPLQVDYILPFWVLQQFVITTACAERDERRDWLDLARSVLSPNVCGIASSSLPTNVFIRLSYLTSLLFFIVGPA